MLTTQSIPQFQCQSQCQFQCQSGAIKTEERNLFAEGYRARAFRSILPDPPAYADLERTNGLIVVIRPVVRGGGTYVVNLRQRRCNCKGYAVRQTCIHLRQARRLMRDSWSEIVTPETASHRNEMYALGAELDALAANQKETTHD